MRLTSGNDYSRLLPYVVVSFMFLGLDFLGWLSGFRTLSERSINPISGIIRSAGLAALQPLSTFRFALSGPTRVADLENRYAESLVKAETVDALTRENESLRTLLGSGASSEYSYTPVQTVSLEGELVLAAGDALGVRAGETLVNENHILIGRVTRVSSWTSWATPISDTHSQVPVMIGNLKIAGIMTGIGDKGIVQVQQSDAVRLGDIVKTSGVQGTFVAGLLIGRVVDVEPESAAIYKNVEVELLGKPTDFVYLVRGIKESQ